MEPTIKKILTTNLTDSTFHTHVSLITPKGKFSFNRQTLEEFWDAYCKCIEEESDPIFGIAEKPGPNLPVLVDIDLRMKNKKPEGDTLYDENHVKTVIETYQSVIRQIVECKEHELICVVLEKEMYEEEKDGIITYKHGFHLHFPYIFLDKDAQEMQLIPRVQICLSEIHLFDYLGITDSGAVVDKGCCRAHWLLYGSRKSPEKQPYMITKVYDSNLEEISLEKAFRDYQIFDIREQLIPIRGKVLHYLPRILSIVPWKRECKKTRPGIISPLKEKMKRERRSAEGHMKMTVEESLTIARKLLPMLADFRVVDRNEWMTIGWTLYNISDGHPDGLDLWQDFSARCEEKYDENACIHAWEHMIKKDLTIGTLRHYASIDNPLEYKKFKEERSEKHVIASLDGSHNDIAKALYEEYGDEFRCASVINKIWFQFSNHVWESVEEGVFLREKISGQFAKKYYAVAQKLYEEMQTTQSQDKGKDTMLSIRIKQVNKLISNLKSAPFKNNVMRENIEVFYDPRFRERLDMNPWLIAFNNGVYDLQQNIFRLGRPEDFLSKKMPINYHEFNEDDEQVQDVQLFLEKIFPDDSVRQYFLDITCSVFVGGNREKIVLFWLGEGDNGKSVTQKFFELMLGKLAIKLNTNVITGKKPSAGAAFADLARGGGGTRWVVLEEPDSDEMINIGIFKHLSGNDSYYARDLFERGKDGREITPLFKLIFVCLDGKTLVSLPNGTSVSLEKLKNNKTVLGWDNKTNGVLPVVQQNFLDRDVQDCLTITLLDGRTITCTPNHKFLTDKNEWIEAQNIELGCTNLVMAVDYPKCDDMFESYDYQLKTARFTFDMTNQADRESGASFCRLLGYMLTDGTWNKTLYVGHLLDCDSIISDIKLLTGKSPKVFRNRAVWQLNVPIELTDSFSSVSPIQKGGRINNAMKLPDFIFDEQCPTFLIREFLAGMFGGDGIVPLVLGKNVFTSLQLVCSKIGEHKQSAIDEYERLTTLIKCRFNIDFYVREEKYEENKYHVFLTSNGNLNFLRFAENIGFRFCCHKTYRITAIASFVRYKNINKISSNNVHEYMNKTKFCTQVSNSTTLPCYQMPVIKITKVGKRHVYDLNIEESYSNFIANGAITHNCNKLPRMKSADKAVWSRVRVIPFESTFVKPDDKEKPLPATFEQQKREKTFLMDKSLCDRIPGMVEAFAWVLLQHRIKTAGQPRIEPDKVLAATENYRKQNDIYRQFVEEHFVDDEKGEVALPEIYNMFREWFRDSMPGHSVPIKNEVEEYLTKLWGEPFTKVNKKWKGHRVQSNQEKVNNGLDVKVLLTNVITTPLEM